jgi:hypothetical protein
MCQFGSDKHGKLYLIRKTYRIGRAEPRAGTAFHHTVLRVYHHGFADCLIKSQHVVSAEIDAFPTSMIMVLRKPPALPAVMTSSSGASIIFGVNAGCSIGGSLENHVKQIADKDDGRSHNTKEGKQ